MLEQIHGFINTKLHYVLCVHGLISAAISLFAFIYNFMLMNMNPVSDYQVESLTPQLTGGQQCTRGLGPGLGLRIVSQLT